MKELRPRNKKGKHLYLLSPAEHNTPFLVFSYEFICIQISNLFYEKYQFSLCFSSIKFRLQRNSQLPTVALLLLLNILYKTFLIDFFAPIQIPF